MYRCPPDTPHPLAPEAPAEKKLNKPRSLHYKPECDRPSAAIAARTAASANTPGEPASSPPCPAYKAAAARWIGSKCRARKECSGCGETAPRTGPSPCIRAVERRCRACKSAGGSATQHRDCETRAPRKAQSSQSPFGAVASAQSTPPKRRSLPAPGAVRVRADNPGARSNEVRTAATVPEPSGT